MRTSSFQETLMEYKAFIENCLDSFHLVMHVTGENDQETVSLTLVQSPLENKKLLKFYRN